MRFTIIDCYTDEASGLGVLPTLGTYPRYIAGALTRAEQEFSYLTIDDIRATVKLLESSGKDPKLKPLEKEVKTNTKIRNLTPNFAGVKQILNNTDVLIIIAGTHTPGKYLSAYPGTTKEIVQLLEKLQTEGKRSGRNKKNFTVLTGPAAHAGSGLWGGTISRAVEEDLDHFDLIVKDLEYKVPELLENNFTVDPKININYKNIEKNIVLGGSLIKQLPLKPEFLIAEIETMKGCSRKVGCSFCTEPIKCAKVERREIKNIIAEIKALHDAGIENFRLGKQTCFYSYGSNEEIEELLKQAKKYSKILHIDNVNPLFVNEEKTKSIVKYCTAGNIAAFGVESFDPEVVKKNRLNTSPDLTFKAIKIINKYGAERGENGLPKFLPGINLIFGLIGESKKTNEHNIYWLQKILDEGLLLRRINIREVVVFPGTMLAEEAGDRFLKKNRKFYWKWRNDIRQKIDFPMLKRIAPEGTVMRDLRTEIYDGNTTFCRQLGTYPLVVGVKGRLGLDKFVDIKVKSHML
ncbi:MAG: radical SAM protein, partial [Nanoarchaeota archaeon]|nr:radical SAM protein [Nanoarchaeota archaeon]